MKRYTQPTKLEIGACKAKPRISEINPNDTTAAYQLTKSTEMIMKVERSPAPSLVIRLRLNRDTALGRSPRHGRFPKIKRIAGAPTRYRLTLTATARENK